MTRLLSALAILAPLLVVPAIAQDFNQGYFAYTRGDFATALKEWRPLAERGSTLAQYNLGGMYYNGEGVTQDYKEAKKWFDRAAAHEYAPAQTSLGIIYGEGQGVRRDYAEAVKWYRFGAEQGHAPAQVRLSLQYADGKGVPKDLAEAVKWFDIAAELGDTAAPRYRDALIGLLAPDEVAAAESQARLWLLQYQR
jgi:TPR repeat protein